MSAQDADALARRLAAHVEHDPHHEDPPTMHLAAFLAAAPDADDLARRLAARTEAKPPAARLAADWADALANDMEQDRYDDDSHRWLRRTRAVLAEALLAVFDRMKDMEADALGADSPPTSNNDPHHDPRQEDNPMGTSSSKPKELLAAAANAAANAAEAQKAKDNALLARHKAEKKAKKKAKSARKTFNTAIKACNDANEVAVGAAEDAADALKHLPEFEVPCALAREAVEAILGNDAALAARLINAAIDHAQGQAEGEDTPPAP